MGNKIIIKSIGVFFVIAVMIQNQAHSCEHQNRKRNVKELSALERELVNVLDKVEDIRLCRKMDCVKESFLEFSAFHHPNGDYVFAWKRCPLIRINVRFNEVNEGNWRNVIDKKWSIRNISNPYLEYIPD